VLVKVVSGRRRARHITRKGEVGIRLGGEAAPRWRDHVAGRKILLVLDDAAGHEQVRPLLPGAAASHQQALALFSDLGNLLGQAEALNRLGELSSRTSATARARDYHTQALAIARDIRAVPEEARALEGIGNSHLREGNPAQADAYLRQALTISQRIGAPGAQRIEETLRDPEWPEGTE
jgi:tetratricopeptide (TPR) repeat protein